MAEKILNTRLQLKIDTFANWSLSDATTQANKTNGDFVLKHGEIGLCEIKGSDSIQTVDPNGLSKTQVLFKVGDGTTPFKNLQWASALAADVYSWAKENKITITKNGTGNVVSGIEWDTTANGGKGGIKFTTAAVATAEGLEGLQQDVSDLEQEVYGEGGTKDNSRIDKLEKDIADNRAVWETTYTFAETGDGKGITITPSEGAGKTISFAFLTKDEIEELGFAYASDLNEYTTTANLDAKITELNYAKKAITLVGYGIGDAYTKTEVDTAIQSAKDYADQNDANTEYHVEYDSTAKKIKLVAGADASKMEIPTDDFIKDGMIQSVAISEDGKNLVITWNTDAGKEATEIPLSELVDVMTGVDGTTITVNVSADDKISAEVKTNSLKDGHIAADAAIAKSKLATDVQTSLGKADTALQAADISNLATKNEATYTGDGTNISVSDNAISLNSTIAVNQISTVGGTGQLTLTAQGGVSLAGEFASLVVNNENVTISNGAQTNTQIEITPDNFVNINNAKELRVTAAEGISLNGENLDNIYAKSADLATIAKTGNVNNLVQTAGDVLVFNCGTSTEVI